MDIFYQIASKDKTILPQTIFKHMRKAKGLKNYGDWIIAYLSMAAINKTGRKVSEYSIKKLLSITDCKTKSTRTNRELTNQLLSATY